MGVQFLYHEIVKCDYECLVHTIHGHDITVRIPGGAVAMGDQIYLEIAVAMYGPFEFLKHTRPISPILWLCFVEEYTLKKPFKMILPHFLCVEDKTKHQICFAKAKHEILPGQQRYHFHPLSIQTQFATSGSKNYGILETSHCCFMCLQEHKEQSSTLAKDAGYCLVQMVLRQHQRSEIYFFVIFFLDTCLRVRYS